MRTYGRVSDEFGNRRWVIVTTDAQGFNDLIWLTTLAQALYLSPGESPFYSNYGVPAVNSIQTQIPPDFYIARMQQLFAPHFASLSVRRLPDQPDPNAPRGQFMPTYQFNAITHQGAVLPALTVPTSIPV